MTNEISPKIILTLHHDYLAIERAKGKYSDSMDIHLPIKTAKLIKDMYMLRHAKNEEEDLLHYSQDEFNNPEYELNVMLMDSEYNSTLEWIEKTIKPYTKEELAMGDKK
jgi:hypothetical protein